MKIGKITLAVPNSLTASRSEALNSKFGGVLDISENSTKLARKE